MLINFVAQNAAMLLGAYPDPRTGQGMVDLEGAREMIDMLDALREATRGNLRRGRRTLAARRGRQPQTLVHGNDQGRGQSHAGKSQGASLSYGVSFRNRRRFLLRYLPLCD